MPDEINYHINNCHHCNGVGELLKDGASVSVKCGVCGMQSPKLAASVEYGAIELAVETWNRVTKITFPVWTKPATNERGYGRYYRCEYGNKYYESVHADNKTDPSTTPGSWKEFYVT